MQSLCTIWTIAEESTNLQHIRSRVTICAQGTQWPFLIRKALSRLYKSATKRRIQGTEQVQRPAIREDQSLWLLTELRRSFYHNTSAVWIA
ncbi:hypothetical protein NPIL_238151 [Nephila pilipes]|uniref:Uncharacterized protein n=1 Tax=Nephila pilipes TaxID=299642 RepID=A0A8X6U881_NEPPI|nr:hypothetical protein NPIL_238151 [Nephila pilipes]